jgi:4-amino-4-deoxy-L-arabinose transferase-like glycosyltransferase
MTSMNNSSTTQLTRYQWAVVALAFFTFFMSAFLSRTVFERLPHLEDEVAYLFQARVFARGDIIIETPQPRRAYWQPFVVDHNGSRFSKYTPGWPGLLSLGVNVGQTWVINAFFAVLTVALVYRLGSNLFNRDVGLIAASLTAFSPMALLLNASLMGHTPALFFTTLFILAYRKIEKTHRIRWGMVAGFSLGMVVILRPLTAIGIGVPFIIWSVIRVIDSLIKRDWQHVSRVLIPLIALSVVTLVIASAIPIYNYMATGEASRNLYTFVWNYDQLGYGECCGRHGHTLERAMRHARFDLSLTAADVFGWQLGAITDEIRQHWLVESDYFPNIGLGFFLLPFGVLVGFLTTRYRPSRRVSLALLVGWLIGLAVFLSLALDTGNDRIRDVTFAWLWVIGAAIWLLAPLIVLRDKRVWQARWTWLLLCVALGLVLAQMTYWIGSQRYSTRYYFEGLASFSILSALPIAYVARHWNRLIIYIVVALILVYSLADYSLSRVTVLTEFNRINQGLIDDIKARQEGDTPLLVLMNGALSGDNRVRWRALGTLMAVTSPYLDSEIIGAWDYDSPEARAEILASFPNRQVIEMYASGNEIEFVDSTEDSG